MIKRLNKAYELLYTCIIARYRSLYQLYKEKRKRTTTNAYKSVTFSLNRR